MGYLVKLVTWMRPDKGKVAKSRLKLLGSLSTVAPEMALEEAEGEVELMGGLCVEALEKTSRYVLMEREDSEILKRVEHLEEITDNIQKEVTLFLTGVLQTVVTHEQARRSYALIRISDEMESILDYCVALIRYKARILRDKLELTPHARSDLRDLQERLAAFLAAALKFSKEHTSASNEDEEVRDLIRQADAIAAAADAARDGHLKRAQDGSCHPLAGIAFSDMLNALRRVKSHIVNIIDARVGRWEERREELRILDRDANEESDRQKPVAAALDPEPAAPRPSLVSKT